VTWLVRFAPSRSSSARNLADSLSAKSSGGGVGGGGSSRHHRDGIAPATAAGRRSRVIFDAFNLEEASDDVVKDQGGGVYDAGKRPLKVHACVGSCVMIKSRVTSGNSAEERGFRSQEGFGCQ
jgi:hypothetical protein